MSYQRRIINHFQLSTLQKRLTDKLGFSISGKPACAILSNQINSQNQGRISETTLYRLFLQPLQHQPYQHTLDLLARFLGYYSWDAFATDIDQLNSRLISYGILQSAAPEKSLLYYCLSTESHKPLLSFFEAIEEEDHYTKETVSIALFDALKQIPQPLRFFKECSGNRFVREYFYEKGVDPAFRIKDYEAGLLHYLHATEAGNSYSDFQDFIFANAVLFRYYYLRKDKQQAAATAQKLYVRTTPSHEALEGLYIFPRMRYRAYKIWYYQITGSSLEVVDDYIHELLDYCRSAYPQQTELERKIAFYTTAEALLHSGLSDSYHWMLKDLFQMEFSALPSHLYTKPLAVALPYFEVNGILRLRPI